MNQRHVVFGCNGPVGVELMHQLVKAGHEVTGVCRSGKADALEGASVVAGDAAKPADAARIAAGADTIHSCIGIDYTKWTDQWMPIVEGLLHAAEQTGAKLIFADNLYCYGPQMVPLREDMPLTRHGKKPALRARMVNRMLEAHEQGKVRVAFVRASDFFGPRVTNALLGDRVFPPALRGRAAQLIPDANLPHAFTYVPDFARALVAVSEANDALGQAWHVPNPPTKTTREVVEKIYLLAGQTPKFSVMPKAMLSILGWFVPILRELNEMQFQRDMPYEVDTTRFEKRFGWKATPWDEALAATVEWYRGQ